MDRIGEERTMNCGMKAKIIAYRNNKDIDVKFEDGYIIKNTIYGNFKRGKIGNPYATTVYEFGYFGEGRYTARINNKNTEEYTRWHGMLKRCYDGKYQNKYPTYIGCTVDEEWLNFQNFAEWYILEKEKYNLNEKLELDKDILIKSNKIYSKNTCVLVPKKINLLFTKNDLARSDLPIGVKHNGDKFQARLSIDGKEEYLGTFDTTEEAFYCYKKAKEKEIKRVADLYKDKIPTRLYEAMHNYKVEITD